MPKTAGLIDGFCPEAGEEFGKAFYVYALVDPDPSLAEGDPRRYFYVGKGIGNRCFAHAAEQLKRGDTGGLNPKLARIAAIRKPTGHRPPIEIVASGLSEEEAFRIESILIKLLRTEGNAVLGKRAGSYWRSVEEVNAAHANPLCEADLGARVLLVSLNGGDHSVPWPEIREEDLPYRVLGRWRVSHANAAGVEYIAGVYQELVRCVFKTPPGPERFVRRIFGPGKNGQPIWKCTFNGERCPQKEEEWGRRRIVSADGRSLTKFERQRGTRLVGVSGQ